MRRINKRGQQMTLGTIIGIVLGIAVLVFLIFGFSTGWSNMWSKITGVTSQANVEDKITDCETDCALNEVTAYCSEDKDLRFFNNESKIVKISATCAEFADSAFNASGKVGAGQIKDMGFDGCSSISCS